jgi:hypothetical protein
VRFLAEMLISMVTSVSGDDARESKVYPK